MRLPVALASSCLAANAMGAANQAFDLQLLVHLAELPATQLHAALLRMEGGEQATTFEKGLRKHAGLCGQR